MGSDKSKGSRAYDDEKPQHEVMLPGYWIRRYPVTVAQYRAFAQEQRERAGQADLTKPDDHPVTEVTWHDAVAYCQWLSANTGPLVTLPTEAHWEKAARGTDGRTWPWGAEHPGQEHCNFDMQVGGTTPVGRYSPTGDCPYGCADMAGNVWEWCSSLFESYPYKADDGREDPAASGTRVLRGEAFGDNRGPARCAVRLARDPGSRSGYMGFRLVVFSPGSSER